MAKFIEQPKSLFRGIGFKLSLDDNLNCHNNLLSENVGSVIYDDARQTSIFVFTPENMLLT